MPFELLRWTIAERFHWTLDEIDALRMDDLEEFLQIEDGRTKAGQPLVDAAGDDPNRPRRHRRR